MAAAVTVAVATAAAAAAAAAAAVAAAAAALPGVDAWAAALTLLRCWSCCTAAVLQGVA